MDLKPKLALELGPQIIERCQPRWLFRVNPSAKNDENGVFRRCTGANPVAIRAFRTNFDNEDAARTRCPLNNWLLILHFFRNRNGEALANQEFGGFEVGVFLCEAARIASLHRQFPTERERDQQEQQENGEKPPKRGRIAHVSHLAR